MRHIIIVLLWWLTGTQVYGQQVVSERGEYTLKLWPGSVPVLDSAFLGELSSPWWDGTQTRVSRAEQSRLITQLSMAYTQSARVNPFFTTLGNNVLADEKVVYCWFSTTAGGYDSLHLFFKDSAPAERAVYFLSNHQAWQRLSTDTLQPGYIRAKITQPGFYAVFKPRAQSFSPGDYFSSYPNPFNPVLGEVCRLCYFLEVNAEVTVQIFTKTGDEVFAHTYRPGENGGLGSSAGLYMNTITWDGRNKQGRWVDSGGYLCRISVKDKYTRTWKIGVKR